MTADLSGTGTEIPANISSKKDLQARVEKTHAAFGRISILVCNVAADPAPAGRFITGQTLVIDDCDTIAYCAAYAPRPPRRDTTNTQSYEC